ncbi:MAG: periplasmic heavy metal sensor, partial [bacterium]|nr:periplasmic heavy metal sensor [bacterium]
MDGIKNNKTWFTILLVLLNLALLFSIWYPRLKTTETVAVKKETPRQGRINTGYWNQIEYYLREELKFTEEQVERFKQLQSEHLVRAKALRDKNHKIRNEIMTLLFDDNPNKSEVEKLSHDLGVMHEKLEKEIFFHFMDLMAACQPDQRANFKQLLHKVFERQRPPEPPPGHRPRQHPPGDGHSGQGPSEQGHPEENGLENRRPGTQGQARPGQQGREDLNVPGRDS